MKYLCPRCDSADFAIDVIQYKKGFAQESYDVVCRNCGGLQGELDVNAQTGIQEPYTLAQAA